MLEGEDINKSIEEENIIRSIEGEDINRPIEGEDNKELLGDRREESLNLDSPPSKTGENDL